MNMTSYPFARLCGALLFAVAGSACSGVSSTAPAAPVAAAPKMTGLRSAAHTTVTIHKNVGGNPSQTAAMAAAPQ